MPPVRQAHGQHRIPGLHHREVDRHVRAAAAVRLDVGMFRPEKLLGPFDGQALDFIHEFTAVVIPLAGIALGVLVRQHRPLRLAHGPADIVFRGNEFDVLALALRFTLNRGVDLGVALMNRLRLGHPHRAGIDLLDPPVMAGAGFELRGKPRIQNAGDLLHGRDGRPQGHDIGIVVLPRHPGHLGVEYLGGAHARKLVRRHAHAHAGRADQDALLQRAFRHPPGHFNGEIGVIHRFRAVGAEVRHLHPGALRQKILDLPFHLKPAVIRSQSDFHVPFLQKSSRQPAIWRVRQDSNL